MMSMDTKTFASSSQEELIGWAVELASSVADGELKLDDEKQVTTDDLIFALSIYKLLADKNLVVKDIDYQAFTVDAENELRRRSLVTKS
jgi:hypothetical protein